MQRVPLFSTRKDCGKITHIYPSISRDMINSVSDGSIFMTINHTNDKKGAKSTFDFAKVVKFV